jgi:hypothetical protein
MTKEKSRKELLSTNDEFVTFSARMLVLAREHKKQMEIIGYCILAVIILFTAGNMYLKNRNSRAQDAYNKAYYAISGNISPDKKQETMQNPGRISERCFLNISCPRQPQLPCPSLPISIFLKKNMTMQ